MSDIIELNKQIQKFNFNKELRRIIKENADMIIDLNRDQLRMGKQGDGDTRDYRSLSYALDKQESGTYFAPFPKVDYFNTGSFHNKMYLKLSSDEYNIDSKDSKRDELVKFEGEEILELNPESQEMAQEIITELMIDKISKIFE